MTRNDQRRAIIRRNYDRKLWASILCRRKCGNYSDTGVSKSFRNYEFRICELCNEKFVRIRFGMLFTFNAYSFGLDWLTGEWPGERAARVVASLTLKVGGQLNPQTLPLWNIKIVSLCPLYETARGALPPWFSNYPKGNLRYKRAENFALIHISKLHSWKKSWWRLWID